MKISIITVCYNSAETIEDTIQSVLSQTFKNVEYIIVDGNSKDGTQKIIEKYRSDIATYISEPDQGLYDAMNKGVALATGDVIGILNSDDVFNGTKVLDFVNIAMTDSEIDACYGDLVYVEKDNLNIVRRIWKSSDYHEGLWPKGWVPAHPTFFARKSVYERYGNFDTKHSLAADYELLIRFIGKYKIKVKYIPEILVRMRLGGETNKSIQNILKQNLEILNAAKRNGFSFFFPSFIFRKLLSKRQQFKNANLLEKKA